MSDNPNFDRRATKHVVIERIAAGRWQERARFAEITDAGDYAIWRERHYGAIFAAIGFETMVVTEPDAGTENVIVDAKPQARRPTLDQDLGDGRVGGGAWPKFDS